MSLSIEWISYDEGSAWEKQQSWRTHIIEQRHREEIQWSEKRTLEEDEVDALERLDHNEPQNFDKLHTVYRLVYRLDPGNYHMHML